MQAAAGATLSALVELVPEDARNTALFAGAVDEILGRLARATVGQDHVAADRRAAIVSALAPILADRIVNQDVSNAARTAWEQATAWQGGARLDATRAGKVNRMLHVAVPPSETIRPTDWGAVVEFPEPWWNDDALPPRFGVTCRQLLGGEYRIARADRNRCRPRLVRLGAACDQAQNRLGPLLYLFGLEIPVDVERREDNTGIVRRPAAEWSSPTLLLATGGDPVILAVNARYWITVVPIEAAGWQPVYRLREQLLMHLIVHASGHMARPGIVHL